MLFSHKMNKLYAQTIILCEITSRHNEKEFEKYMYIYISRTNIFKNQL